MYLASFVPGLLPALQVPGTLGAPGVMGVLGASRQSSTSHDLRIEGRGFLRVLRGVAGGGEVYVSSEDIFLNLRKGYPYSGDKPSQIWPMKPLSQPPKRGGFAKARSL